MKKWHKYVVIGMISFVLLCIVLTGIAYITLKAEPEIVLIPKGYEGEVIIVYDQKQGSPAKYVDQERIYEIPKDGILMTQSAWNAGFTNRKFYYIQDGLKEELEMVPSAYSPQTDQANLDKVSIIDKRPYFYGCSEDGKQCIFRAARFIVSQRKNFDQYSVEEKINTIIETTFE